jgi:iron complex transport system substrate-binding protein
MPHRRLLAGLVILGLVAAWIDPLRAEPIPRRIVSLVPAVTEMLFAIGAGEQVVGVSRFDRYPPEVATRVRVGGLLDPDMERLFALAPDLVVVYRSQTELSDRLRRAGIATIDYAHGGVADIPRLLRALGRRTGHGREAETVARGLEDELGRVRAAVGGRPRPPTLVVFGREPGSLRTMYASGGVGFLHDLVEIAGGRNVFAHIRRESVPITAEAVLAAAPEVIVELRAGPTEAADPPTEERDPWRTLSAVPAVRTGRVYRLVGDELVIPGPRIGLAARRLARVLHPEARP